MIIVKAGESRIAALVERVTRFTMLTRIRFHRNAERLVLLLANKRETLPEFLRKSVT